LQNYGSFGVMEQSVGIIIEIESAKRDKINFEWKQQICVHSVLKTLLLTYRKLRHNVVVRQQELRSNSCQGTSEVCALFYRLWSTQ